MCRIASITSAGSSTKDIARNFSSFSRKNWTCQRTVVISPTLIQGGKIWGTFQARIVHFPRSRPTCRHDATTVATAYGKKWRNDLGKYLLPDCCVLVRNIINTWVACLQNGQAAVPQNLEYVRRLYFTNALDPNRWWNGEAWNKALQHWVLETSRRRGLFKYATGRDHAGPFVQWYCWIRLQNHSFCGKVMYSNATPFTYIILIWTRKVRNKDLWRIYFLPVFPKYFPWSKDPRRCAWFDDIMPFLTQI